MSDELAVDAGAVEDFVPGKCRAVKAGRRQIAVVRLAGDRFRAVLDRCPHRSAPLSYGVVSGTLLPSDPDDLQLGMEGGVLRCPWHGYEFSLETGECLFTGAKLRVPTFPVEVRDGRVRVIGAMPRRAANEKED